MWKHLEIWRGEIRGEITASLGPQEAGVPGLGVGGIIHVLKRTPRLEGFSNTQRESLLKLNLLQITKLSRVNSSKRGK